jgi:type I restriction enzyme S subunit
MQEGVAPSIDASKERLSDAGAAITPLVPEGALLLSFKLSLGKLAFAGRPLRTNEAIASLVPKEQRTLDQKFLYWYLRSFDWAKAARGSEKIKGATLNKAKLKEILIPIPPLVEQKRIVAILDEAFEGIAKATTNTERSVANARELFGREVGRLMVQLAGSEPRYSLKEVCGEFGRGKSRHRPRNDPKLYGGPYPFIQTGDLSGRFNIVEAFGQSYSEEGLAQSKLWPRGTVCIAIVGATIGESAILGFDACFPDSVIGMVADPKKALPEYIQYLLVTHKDDIKAKGVGSARHNINLATFEDQMFPFPSVARQREIVTRVEEIAATLFAFNETQMRRLALLTELRGSILYKAFSGRLIDKGAIAA